MKEKWKPIKDFEGYYSVSNSGNVRRENTKFSSEHILKPYKDYHNSLRVCLSKNNKVTRIFVHRLVCSAFLPNPENKRTVNHKDGNRLNNNLNNLEWATHSENVTHAYNVLGVRAVRGNNHYASKLTVKNVLQIRKLRFGGYGYKKLSEKFGISYTHIVDICNRRKWSWLNGEVFKKETP